MCYMEASSHPASAPEPEEVGVRHLRQNLSVYLRRVQAGEELTVTERGVPVARLAPLRPVTSPLQQMIDAGLVRMPKGRLDFSELPRLPAIPGFSISQALEEQREDSV
jgi:prevent-host-death family protein